MEELLDSRNLNEGNFKNYIARVYSPGQQHGASTKIPGKNLLRSQCFVDNPTLLLTLESDSLRRPPLLCSSRVPCHRIKTKVAARGGGGGKKADYIFYFASLSSKAMLCSSRLYIGGR